MATLNYGVAIRCAYVEGIRTPTLPVVKGMLYPLSYSGTQDGT